MNAYEHYTLSDFMQDPDFRSWVLYDDPLAASFWKQWLVANPDREALVLQASELLVSLREVFDELSEEELDSQVQLAIASLRRRSDRDDALRRIEPRWTPHSRWLVAAGIFLALLGGWYSFVLYPPPAPLYEAYEQAVEQAGPSMREIANTSASNRQVLLPDGSRITLFAHSRLSYDPWLGTQPQRRVYLTGGAFFSVKRNPAQPFLVYANGVVTKVLGTSFSIRAYEGQPEVMVSVRTGRVSVFSATKSGTALRAHSVFDSLSVGILLTANQQATYQLSSNRMVKSIVERPVLTHPDALPINTVFTDAPVSRIFTQIEQAYSITIAYDKGDFANCVLTARFSDESLEEKIKLICASIGASYEIIDAQIVVTGTGCR